MIEVRLEFELAYYDVTVSSTLATMPQIFQQYIYSFLLFLRYTFEMLNRYFFLLFPKSFLIFPMYLISKSFSLDGRTYVSDSGFNSTHIIPGKISKTLNYWVINITPIKRLITKVFLFLNRLQFSSTCVDYKWKVDLVSIPIFQKSF